MKKQIQFKERGQALVMIALAAVILFAFAALAIDGSIVFSDRRHSQNASDTAVLAAALAKVRATSPWKDTGKARAAENGYTNDGVTVVELHSCSDWKTLTGKDCQGLPVNANPAEYIHVHIKSVVKLTFARILGWQEITNHTEAVARATEPITKNWYDGYGITSTHQGCWASKDGPPFVLGGSATTIVNGAGVLVSAVCPGEDTFVVNGNASTLNATTGVCAPGTTNMPPGDADNIAPPGLKTNCNVPPPDSQTMPAEPICDNQGKVTESNVKGVYTATPGYYNSTFPSDVQGGQATIKLGKGVYCLKDGIDIGAGWDLTTDTNGNGAHDPANEGVFFFIPTGDITFNGGAFAFLHAISSNTSSSFQKEWLNLLMYIPPTNKAEVKITGGSGSVFTGTILAPASIVTLAGSNSTTGGTVTLDSQIIADTVKTTGNTALTIVYNEANNAEAPTNPGIELIQ